MTLHCFVATAVIVAVGGGRHHGAAAGRRRVVEALILIDNPLSDDAVHRLLVVRGQIWGQEFFTTDATVDLGACCHVGKALFELHHRSFARRVECALTFQFLPSESMVRPQMRPVVARARQTGRHRTTEGVPDRCLPAASLHEQA